MTQDPHKGVNLGGWLLLEKWMTPSLFDGASAEDEWGLMGELGDEAQRRIHRHRESFIAESDFEWLRKRGYSLVRLPVSYGIYGDEPPLMSTKKYVDRVFSWATKHDMKVLLDLHGLKGSQNGHMHSGKQGPVHWRDTQNMYQTFQVIDMLIADYADRSAFYGIQVINEPSAKGLIRFYRRVYKHIRRNHGSKVRIIFSDAFRPRRVALVLWLMRMKNIVLDIHLYQTEGDANKHRSFDKRLRVVDRWRRMLNTIHSYLPVVVGEWSAAFDKSDVSYGGLSREQVATLERQYGSAQEQAFVSAGVDHFYWTYRTEQSGVWSVRSAEQ